MAAADETLIFTTKRKELFFFDGKLFRTVGVNENNTNVNCIARGLNNLKASKAVRYYCSSA